MFFKRDKFNGSPGHRCMTVIFSFRSEIFDSLLLWVYSVDLDAGWHKVLTYSKLLSVPRIPLYLLNWINGKDLKLAFLKNEFFYSCGPKKWKSVNNSSVSWPILKSILMQVDTNEVQLQWKFHLDCLIIVRVIATIVSIVTNRLLSFTKKNCYNCR